MDDPAMVVISTGLNAPTKERCIESVRAQLHPAFHIYVEAGGQFPPKGVIENLRDAALTVGPDSILVWLDGDDWLPHPRVLGRIAELYRDPRVWLTYGSYVCADGRPGHVSEYRTEDYRREPWKASHLRTFKAWLFGHILDRDLRNDAGEYWPLVCDQAVMLPMLEMCGRERAKFCPEVLCVYNYGASWEARATGADLVEEARTVLEIRGRTPYARLEEV